MSPAEAAELHKLWTGKVPGSVKIGSPSVARGGQKWMDVSQPHRVPRHRSD
jgi:hypothetical protein